MSRANIISMFGGGRKGYFFDVSDTSTLWQDTERTVAVTTDGDPVRAIDDLSGNGRHAIRSSDSALFTYRTDGTYHWLEGPGNVEVLNTQFLGTPEPTVAIASRMHVGGGEALLYFQATSGVIGIFAWIDGGVTSVNFNSFNNDFYGSVDDREGEDRVDVVKFKTGDYSSNGASIIANRTELSLSLIDGTVPNKTIAAEGSAFVGRGGSSSAANWDGRIYAVVCVETDFTTQEQIEVEDYLASVSGASLPSVGETFEVSADVMAMATSTAELVAPEPVSEQILYWAVSIEEANELPAGTRVAILDGVTSDITLRINGDSRPINQVRLNGTDYQISQIHISEGPSGTEQVESHVSAIATSTGALTANLTASAVGLVTANASANATRHMAMGAGGLATANAIANATRHLAMVAGGAAIAVVSGWIGTAGDMTGQASAAASITADFVAQRHVAGGASSAAQAEGAFQRKSQMTGDGTALATMALEIKVLIRPVQGHVASAAFATGLLSVLNAQVTSSIGARASATCEIHVNFEGLGSADRRVIIIAENRVYSLPYEPRVHYILPGDMTMHIFTKQPSDHLDYDLDFSEWITDEDHIVSVDYDVDSDVIEVTGQEIADTFVKFWLRGGDDGKTYKFTVRASTQFGREKEVDFRVRVRDL